MNPYKTAQTVRATYNQLNTFAYQAFDNINPQMRKDLSIILNRLNELASNIEHEADKEIEEGNCDS
jgi:hypothetical protein